MNLVQLYRKMRYSGGYGVHSPFVFRLITQVIGEKECAYYAYDDMDMLRRKLKHNPETATVEKQAITRKKGELLFRLANDFAFRSILQLGASQGLPALYLTAYSKEARCLILEEDKEQVALAQKVLSYSKTTRVNLEEKSSDSIQKELTKSELEGIDCFYFHLPTDAKAHATLLRSWIPMATEESVFILNDIRTNKEAQQLWKELIEHPRVTVSIELYDIGLLLLNTRYNKKHYNVYY